MLYKNDTTLIGTNLFSLYWINMLRTFNLNLTYEYKPRVDRLQSSRQNHGTERF